MQEIGHFNPVRKTVLSKYTRKLHRRREESLINLVTGMLKKFLQQVNLEKKCILFALCLFVVFFLFACLLI